MQRVFKTAQLSLLQYVDALEETAFGKFLPQRLKLVPLGFQPAFEPDDHLLVGRVQRLDVIGRQIRKKSNAVTPAAVAFAYFQDAAGADVVTHCLAKRFLPWLAPQDGLQHHRRVADRHETRGLEHMHQRQRALRRTSRHQRADLLAAGSCRRQRDLAAHLERLLEVQRPAGPEIFRPGLVVVQALAEIL
jgi:hypothetical protein